MTNELQCEEPRVEMKRVERKPLESVIREQIIQALGKPTGLRKVQVREVWKDHYRVNVLVGLNAASVRIANSYLLKVDSEGGLIAATPQITKQY
jgi:hypothetical protein